MTFFVARLLCLASLSASILIGCSMATKPLSEKTQYYRMDQEVSTQSGSSLPTRWTVGLGPIEIPSYLDRPQLLRVGRDARLYAHDLHRWKTPLQKQIQNQLKTLLVESRKDIRIEEHPFRYAHQIDYQWRVDMKSFEQKENGDVLLRAKIELRDLRRQKTSAERMVEVSEPVANKDFSSLVEAMKECLKVLASEMRSLLPLEAYVVDPEVPKSNEISHFD